MYTYVIALIVTAYQLENSGRRQPGLPAYTVHRLIEDADKAQSIRRLKPTRQVSTLYFFLHSLMPWICGNGQ